LFPESSVVVVQPTAKLNATNSTIASNSGIGLDNAGTANLVNVTIADNEQGGVYVELEAPVSMTNTIVAGNGDGSRFSSDCVGSVSSTTSLDGDGTCKTSVHGDAKLAGLSPNGGPTLTDALTPGSVAIGAGTMSACPTVDQRLAPRSGGCDLGAFQLGAKVPAQTPAPTPSGGGGGGGGGSGGGTSPAAPTSGSASSGSGQSSGAPLTPAAKKARIATLAAAGVLAARGANAVTFKLKGTQGKKTGLVQFLDPRGHVHISVTSLRSVAINPVTHTATLSGAGFNLATGRAVTFTIVVAHGKRNTFRIAMTGGYKRSWTLRSGSVSIKA
jgi:hypothetical protein